MKAIAILPASFALALGAAFVSIGTASVAHADRCDMFIVSGFKTPAWQQCENDNNVDRNNCDSTAYLHINTCFPCKGNVYADADQPRLPCDHSRYE